MDAAGRLDPALVEGLVQRVAARYRLGPVTGWHVITTGFEDANIAAVTADGPVVIKVFPASRGPMVPARTAALIAAALQAGVRHPPLRYAPDGALTRDPVVGCAVLVMDAVPANDYYSPVRAPTPAELAALLEQAALITGIGIAVPAVTDLWALPQLPGLARRMRPHLGPDLAVLVRRAVAAYTAVDHAALPHAMIHGDLTKGNVLASPGGGVWVIDFGCCGENPRLQELVVIAANLTHGAPEPLRDRAIMIANGYRAHVPLTSAEWRALPAYTGAAAAMELLGTLHARHVDGDHRDETDYLLQLGAAGLRDWGRQVS